MKLARIFISLLVVTVLFSCGGDDTTTKKSSDTAASTITPLATLSVLNATPASANGEITVTKITSDVNPSGGDQVIHISGTSGEQGKMKHQIDIHYIIYFVGSDTLGKINQITHAWGSTLEGSLDGGISVCTNPNCTSTTITPTLNTLVFQNQALLETTNISMVAGTVVYP